MREDRKIIRRMTLVIIWILFISLTLSGLVMAYEQTRFVNEGTEIETVMSAKINTPALREQGINNF